MNDGGVTGSGEEIIWPGGISMGEKGEQREGSAGFIGEGSQRPLGLMERGKWGGDRGRGRSGSEVGDNPDMWVPPISGERKRKERKREKGERERSYRLAGLLASGWPSWVAAFFVTFSFSIFCFVISLEFEFKTVWIWILPTL
jgi:hypothetical protein